MSSAAKSIKPIHWKMIRGAITASSCRCVPFLGAGANVASGRYKGLPLGGDVALKLVADLTGKDEEALRALARVKTDKAFEGYEDLAKTSVQDLKRVAFHVLRDSGQAFLDQRLRELLADEKCQPSKLLKTLAKLPFRLIVTTNYDRMMERALDAERRSYIVVSQPPEGFDVDGLKKLQARLVETDDLILYKIHGSFPGGNGDEGGRLILTEEDYIEYLTVAAIEDVGVPQLIKEKLVQGTLLFLGYSLEDWDFRAIFKSLVEKVPPTGRPTSFAFQHQPPKFWVDFWDDKQVKIFDYDVYRFASELDAKCKDLYVKRGRAGRGG